MYDEILVPTDGSEPAKAALDEAIDHAKSHGATLHVLYVVEDHLIPGGVESGAEIHEALKRDGEKAIREARTWAQAAGIESLQVEIGAGKPHEVILDYARDNGIDLIIMGTHGRSGIERALLGSVTERVLRLADQPVLTVREASEGRTDER